MPFKKFNHPHGKEIRPSAAHRAKAPRVGSLISTEHAHFAIHSHRGVVGRHYTKDEIAAALNTVDQGAILRQHRERHVVVIWDKRTPINGVSAEDVLAELGHGYEDIYLVFIDGELVMFQPHAPHVEGFEVLRQDDNLERHALRHVEGLAREAAAQHILGATMDALAVPPPPDTQHLNQFEDDEVPGLDAGG